jgi:hypothetical protein
MLHHITNLLFVLTMVMPYSKVNLDQIRKYPQVTLDKKNEKEHEQ